MLMTLVSSAQQLIELCNGETRTVTYFSTATGDGTTSWSVNGLPFFSDELTYTFSNEGSYNIIVKRENGPCYVEQTLQVVVTECPGVIYWVPNCFTPDGNEQNQLFGPVMTEGYDINGFKFLIGEAFHWQKKDLNNHRAQYALSAANGVAEIFALCLWMACAQLAVASVKRSLTGLRPLSRALDA